MICRSKVCCSVEGPYDMIHGEDTPMVQPSGPTIV